MSVSPELSSRQDDQSTSLEQWKQVRELVVHEDNLSNQRLTWLFNSQALLFAAFALIFQALLKKDMAPEDVQAAKAVLSIVVTIGIFVCLIINSSIEVGVKHLDSITKKWAEQHEDWKPHPPVRGYITGRRYAVLHSRFLPLVFVGSWFALFLVIVATLVNPQAFFWLLFGVLLTYGYFWLYGPENKAGSPEVGRQTTGTSTERAGEMGGR